MLIPFSPPPGLNSDDTTFAAEGRWANGNNVRFYNGQPQVIGRFKKLFATPLSGGINSLFVAGQTHINVPPPIFYGTSTKLYKGEGATQPVDVTPSGGSGGNYWSFGAWGVDTLASPGTGTLYVQTGGSVTAATVIAAAPDRIEYMLVTPQRQVLALGCNEEISTTFNGRCIRGSDLEDHSDWTTSSTNNAFEHILDAQGSIVAGAVIGSYIVVWTTAELYLGQFIGDPSQTYRFDKVEGNCGLAGC